MKSRERKKLYVKDLEMKSKYLEAECCRLSYALQCCAAENMALRHSLLKDRPVGAPTAMQESAVLTGKICQHIYISFTQCIILVCGMAVNIFHHSSVLSGWTMTFASSFMLVQFLVVVGLNPCTVSIILPCKVVNFLLMPIAPGQPISYSVPHVQIVNNFSALFVSPDMAFWHSVFIFLQLMKL